MFPPFLGNNTNLKGRFCPPAEINTKGEARLALLPQRFREKPSKSSTYCNILGGKNLAVGRGKSDGFFSEGWAQGAVYGRFAAPSRYPGREAPRQNATQPRCRGPAGSHKAAAQARPRRPLGPSTHNSHGHSPGRV